MVSNTKDTKTTVDASSKAVAQSSIDSTKKVGSIGNTALYEIAEAPHLHFEVIKNNVSVDPKSFLPKN